MVVSDSIYNGLGRGRYRLQGFYGLGDDSGWDFSAGDGSDGTVTGLTDQQVNFPTNVYGTGTTTNLTDLMVNGVTPSTSASMNSSTTGLLTAVVGAAGAIGSVLAKNMTTPYATITST